VVNVLLQTTMLARPRCFRVLNVALSLIEMLMRLEIFCCVTFLTCSCFDRIVYFVIPLRQDVQQMTKGAGSMKLKCTENKPSLTVSPQKLHVWLTLCGRSGIHVSRGLCKVNEFIGFKCGARARATVGTVVLMRCEWCRKWCRNCILSIDTATTQSRLHTFCNDFIDANVLVFTCVILPSDNARLFSVFRFRGRCAATGSTSLLSLFILCSFFVFFSMALKYYHAFRESTPRKTNKKPLTKPNVENDIFF